VVNGSSKGKVRAGEPHPCLGLVLPFPWVEGTKRGRGDAAIGSRMIGHAGFWCCIGAGQGEWGEF
jgi:hypothetical protein